MTGTRASEVLYESEAALRLVDKELLGFHDVRDVLGVVSHGTSFRPDVPAMLAQANTQIQSVYARLRDGHPAVTPGERSTIDCGRVVR
jgi:aminoglycoside/choline kinase family phosphotransferase